MSSEINRIEGLTYTVRETSTEYGPIRALGSSPNNHPLVKMGHTPFAEDDCGNAFAKASDGKILFWDHETDDLTVLANDWQEFLANCHTPKPITPDKYQVKSTWIDPEFAKEHGLKPK